jgi:hypothetical protein
MYDGVQNIVARDRGMSAQPEAGAAPTAAAPAVETKTPLDAVREMGVALLAVACRS